MVEIQKKNSNPSFRIFVGLKFIYFILMINQSIQYFNSIINYLNDN